MTTPTIGQQMKELRMSMGLTQSDMAYKCHLDIRTIQRIEAGTVIPRAYTLNSINESLGSDLPLNCKQEILNDEKKAFLETFKIRKKIRIGTIIFGLAFLTLIGIFLIVSSTDILFGFAKRQWAPMVYVIMFIDLIVIAVNWRCPGCNGLLGDVFNTNYCSKCGLKLSE